MLLQHSGPTTIATLSALMLSEDLISFAEAAAVFPARNDRRVNTATVWRWRTQGVRLADGRVVKLEAIRCGNRFWTSRQAVVRFVEAQNSGVGEHASVPASEDARQERVERELAEVLG